MNDRDESASAQHVDALLNVLAGRLSTQDAAARCGVTVEELERWQLVFEAAMRGRRAVEIKNEPLPAQPQRNAATRQRRAVLGMVGAVVTCAVLSLWARNALSDPGCTQTLPQPLVTFCSRTPAVVKDVNGNFQQLVTWLETKVGSVGSAGLQTQSLDSGHVTTPVIFSGHPAGGHPMIAGSSDSISINGNGDFSQTTVTGLLVARDGLEVRGQLAASTLRQTSCAWKGTGKDHNADDQMHEVTCDAGRYAAGWRCRANSYLDGDCAVYCCLP